MMKVKGHLGSVAFDGQTVVIEKKLRGQTRIPLAGIQSVSLVPAGLGMRGIMFAVAGGSASSGNAQALGSHSDVAASPYGLTFKSKSAKDFEALVDEIERARYA